MAWFLGMSTFEGVRAFAYGSRTKPNVWLLLAQRNAFDEVPEDVLAEVDELLELGMLELRKGEHYIGMSANAAIEKLLSQGFYLREF